MMDDRYDERLYMTDVVWYSVHEMHEEKHSQDQDTK